MWGLRCMSNVGHWLCHFSVCVATIHRRCHSTLVAVKGLPVSPASRRELPLLLLAAVAVERFYLLCQHRPPEVFCRLPSIGLLFSHLRACAAASPLSFSVSTTTRVCSPQSSTDATNGYAPGTLSDFTSALVIQLAPRYTLPPTSDAFSGSRFSITSLNFQLSWGWRGGILFSPHIKQSRTSCGEGLYL